MPDAPVRVLLVDDDEDDYIITRNLISEIRDRRYQLEWVSNYDDALAAIQRHAHDICLLDYRLGSRTGLELLRESRPLNNGLPMILLTGQGDHEIDVEAMKAGAADYLIKGQLDADKLERAIRYAIEGQQTRERLRWERDLISRIMETSPVGIVVADQAGKITFANLQAEKLLCLAKDDISRKARSVLDWSLTDPEGNLLSGQASSLKLILDSGQPLHDVYFTSDSSASGGADSSSRQRILLSVNGAPLFGSSGKIDGMVVTVEDITTRMAMEAQLRQSQKMESIGQLAAGVAHDINNILTIIQGHVGLLLNAATVDADAVKSLKQISAASERAAGFIRHLLMFSRKQVYRTKILDLNSVLHNLEYMLPRMLGEHISLEIHCSPDLPRIAADIAMVEQIMMNLAINARDAMPKGGKLIVETSAIEITAVHLQPHPEARVGRFVCLTVTDNGCGMDNSVLQRIFEPFFTTKEVGKGTGLGLATVYGIVKQHRGWIEVASELGVGTTFKVFLPVAGESGQLPAASSPESETVQGGQETILMVEDENDLLELMREVLQQYRYRVLTASSGGEALRVWDEYNGQVDLLLTDMIMPGGMTGDELAAELKRRKPGLKIIYASGYTSAFVGRDFGQDDITFLAKPYQPNQVAQLIRETLDATPKGQSSANNARTRTIPALT
ncbi:MAG TPA: response regulator [Candidatus Saccharimonadales bacterium]|nr:response regulator [Candidatus Saccharimonadales bacterium]